jgi:hypothetical protein
MRQLGLLPKLYDSQRISKQQHRALRLPRERGPLHSTGQRHERERVTVPEQQQGAAHEARGTVALEGRKAGMCCDEAEPAVDVAPASIRESLFLNAPGSARSDGGPGGYSPAYQQHLLNLAQRAAHRALPCNGSGPLTPSGVMPLRTLAADNAVEDPAGHGYVGTVYTVCIERMAANANLQT